MKASFGRVAMADGSIVLILLGPPGAGKGTQGARLSASTSIQHVSTGDLFRTAVQANTPAGLRAESYMRSGHLVPDEVVLHVLEEYLLKTRSQDICFDGFPRTRRQAERLDELIEHVGLSLAVVFYISVSDDVALGRLASRGRDDDFIETARYRLNLYHSVTEPLIEYYEQTGVLMKVDGEAEEQVVFDRIEALLAKRDQNAPAN